MTDLASYVTPATFLSLPSLHYSQVIPSGLKDPYLMHYNAALAQTLNLPPEVFTQKSTLAYLSGQAAIDVNRTYSTVYSGHQFGVWAGQLGDGRALFLGDMQDIHGQRYELQLKGAGPTPYSRHGDGRAVVRSSIREYLASIAMHQLGVPTTYALSLVGSRTSVFREDVEYAAIVSRLAPSFIRFGHFEHWASHKNYTALSDLFNFVIQHHYPELNHLEDQQARYRACLQAIFKRTIHLVAHWQSLGFCHGVLNTDNMSILGLTLDYGPFAFLDGYQENYICNHTDSLGRYAYDQQPKVVAWNLYCLARAISPLLDTTSVSFTQDLLDQIAEQYHQAYFTLMAKKLGLQTSNPTTDALVMRLLHAMNKEQADYTLCFRYLAECTENHITHGLFLSLFKEKEPIMVWLNDYLLYTNTLSVSSVERELSMKRANPKVVLRNYLAQTAIEHAEQGDFSYISRLVDALSNPYADDARFDEFASLTPAWAKDICISCSS